ncbi:bacterial transcriptional activator domain-containing protein [Olsenella sp. HMSC062G07]|uniref:bacterial transcriptional activator domain-containing protein n=1 Tax=Olsenella sp. HMSC062G07 TaxID=1739330 RepID=UPI000AD53805|nr:bacterial transcriptional activator domain-containing protein [Olsenella sp. HMSC062G07]
MSRHAPTSPFSQEGPSARQSLSLALVELVTGVAFAVSVASAVGGGGVAWIVASALGCACLILLELFRSGVRERSSAASRLVPSDADDADDGSAHPDAGVAGHAAPGLCPKGTDAQDGRPWQDDGSSPADVTTTAQSQFDLESLAAQLARSDDPLAELKLFVKDIRAREAAPAGAEDVGSRPVGEVPTPTAGASLAMPAQAGASRPTPRLSPSPMELFAARRLEEAGLFKDDVELPQLKIVLLGRSGLFYLRMAPGPVAYLARLRVLGLEAALNQLVFCSKYLESSASEEDCYEANELVLRHICAQARPIDEAGELLEGEVPDGEWATRRQISNAIESLVLPYRLEASFRTNVADGNVAIEFAMTPDRVFPASMLVDQLGVVTSSREMRRKAASAYAQRLAILLAAEAFRASTKVRHVWVAATLDTANRHWCYLSVDFDRGRFSQIDLAHDLTRVSDFERVYRRFVPVIRRERGMLRPVEQSFSLNEARFCPPRRHESPSLSSRRLPPRQAHDLGCQSVYGLAIQEADKRSLIATDILRRLASHDVDKDATARNVGTILELAGDDPDPDVRSAAERTVRGLIDGRLPNEPLAIAEEFVSGDALSRAAAAGRESLARHDPRAALERCERALGEVDGRGLYDDAEGIEWRYFGSYVDRALYNRLFAPPETSIMLVPDGYFECHLICSSARLALGDSDEACRHARRLVELAPLDHRGFLHLVRCLEEKGDTDEAIEALKVLLLRAHDLEGLGIGYYRMASFQWQKGNILAAQAAYHSSIAAFRGSFPLAALELAALAAQHPDTFRQDLSHDETTSLLEGAGIPVAPTKQMTASFLSCMRASVDAEVFPVARSFVSTLVTLHPDDVLIGVMRSLEGEPDA